MRASVLAGAVLALTLTSTLAAAEDADRLYQAMMVTSGTGADRRPAVFAELFARVLVKASGDRRLLADPRVAELAGDAAGYVAGFSYRDRMGGTPLHDEQGSYDRPHDVTVDFDPAGIDAALAGLGSRPWPLPRPQPVLFVAVRNGAEAYRPTGDGEREPGMRDALRVAGERSGLHPAFASQAAVAADGLAVGAIDAVDLAELDRLAAAEGGDVALAGTLDFSDAVFGWIADWRMRWRGEAYAWHVEGVNYDDAYRDAVAGAAQILSGNGAPR